MWEISSIDQGNAFINALLLGGLLCFIYDIFRLDRIVFNRSIFTVFIEDVVFWVISAFLTFCMLLITTNGQIRFFAFLAMTLGFIIYRCTISKILNLVAPYIKKLARKIGNKYLKIIVFLGKTDVFVLDFLKGWKKAAILFKKRRKKEKNNCKNS